MKPHIDKFKDFMVKESINTDFATIVDTIRAYIDFILKTKKNLVEHVPNKYIAEEFKDVLIYSELESKNGDLFHNVKDDPYDSISTNNPDDYDILEDGRFLKKETRSVGINHLLIPGYFDLERLKNDGVNEILRVYQKLREKRDVVRNNIMLGRIVLRDYTHPQLADSYELNLDTKMGSKKNI